MLGAWVKLVRLPNALTAGVGVWLGHACLGGPFPWRSAALGSAAMALLAAAGNVHNDILDLAVDRVNRPDRPLPSGRISPRGALIAAYALALAAVALAAAINPPDALLTAAMAALLWLYNRKLKAMTLWGNLAVSLLCALAIYLPEFPRAPLRTGVPVLFAFLTTLAREIAKDAEDVPGDLAAGLRTLPIRFGLGLTKALVQRICLIVIVLLAFPMTLGYHLGYPLIAVCALLPLLLWCVIALRRVEPDWTSIQKRLKWIMLAGMAAIFAGVWGS